MSYVKDHTRRQFSWAAAGYGALIASLPPSQWFLPGPVCMRGGRSAAFRLRQALSPGKPVGIHLPGGLGKSEKLSNTCGITIWARWILLWNPLERVFGSHFVEATTPEATHTIGQSTPRKCRARRARQQDRAGQARPVYLSSSPSSRAIRSPLKSPACGVGSCIERTKN